jgi:hypothetical protein
LVPPCPTLTFIVAAEARAGSKIRKKTDSRKFTVKAFGQRRI